MHYHGLFWVFNLQKKKWKLCELNHLMYMNYTVNINSVALIFQPFCTRTHFYLLKSFRANQNGYMTFMRRYLVSDHLGEGI